MNPNEAERQFTLFAHSLPDALLLATGQGEIRAANRAAGVFFARPAASLVGMQLSEGTADGPERVQEFLTSCARSREPLPGTLDVRRPDGEILPCRVSGAALIPRSETAPSLLQLRFTPSKAATERFALLSDRVERLTREIGARKRAEARSEEERARLEVTLTSIGDAVITTDNQGNIARMNPVAEELTGWAQAQAVGRACAEIFRITNEETGAEVESPVDRVLREGKIVGLANHTILTARDGTQRPIDDSGAPIRDENGSLHGVVLVFRDITERKRAERELRESEVLYRTLGEAVPDFIWASGADGALRFVNARWTEYTGLTREEERSAPPDFLYHPDDYPPLERVQREAFTRKTPYEVEFRFRRRDGSYRWFLARAVPVMDDSGNLAQWIGTTTDIHERKIVEEALRRSEEQFRFALSRSDISVYQMDADLRYTWVYSGRADGELRDLYGKTDAEILQAEDAAQLTEIKRRVLRTGVEEAHTTRATRSGQEPAYYDTYFVPLRDEEGRIVGITGTTTDSTARKTAQDALAAHQAESAALNVRLQRAMQETHHRVKNNLQVIIGLLDLQASHYTDNISTLEMGKLTQHIQSLAVIHDLLTHQARQDAAVSEVSIQDVIERLLPVWRNIGAARTLDAEVQDVRLPIQYATALAALINELVSNSVKHGAGAITLAFRVNGNDARLELRDEGKGFPDGFDARTAAHIGLELIESTVEWDLQGRITYGNWPEGGAHIVVDFSLPPMENSHAT